jgi:hypothetical protein
MISIEDRLKQSSEQPHQAPFLSGLIPNSKKTSKKTKNHFRTVFRRSTKSAKSYMDNAKSVVESSPSYVKVYDKERPHRIQTNTPQNGKDEKDIHKTYTVMPSVAGAHLDHPMQFISQ